MLIFTSDLFNALDKGNLGNAQTAGLSKGIVQSHQTRRGRSLISIARSQLRTESVQPPDIYLLRTLRRLCPTHCHHREEVWCRQGPPNPHVHIRLHDTTFGRRKQLWWPVRSALFSWYGRVGLLPARHLLSDHILPPWRVGASTGHLLRSVKYRQCICTFFIPRIGLCGF